MSWLENIWRNNEIKESGTNIIKPDLWDWQKVWTDKINKILEVQEIEKISNILDEIWIEEIKQDTLIKDILKIKENRNNVLEEIKQTAFWESDILNILSNYEEKTEVKQEKTEVKQEQIKRKNEINNNLNLKNISLTENKEVVTENKEIDSYKDLINYLVSIKNNLDLNNPSYWNILRNILSFKDNEKIEITEITKELEKLRDPKIFILLADDLGWSESWAYEEFKTLVLNTSVWEDFKQLFLDYEWLESWEKLSANDVIEQIEGENNWIVDIDLSKRPPVSKIRLIWSEYWFNKKINKIELEEITSWSKEELEEIEEKWFWILNEFLKNLDDPNLSLDKFEDLYDYFYIDYWDQINFNDFEDFKNAKTWDEKKKIFKEKLEPKLKRIKQKIIETRAWVLSIYKEDIKYLLIRQKERKEKELEVLDFLNKTGFDLIPKDLTDKLIREIQSNVLHIEWLNIDPEKLDLKNWLFWESSTEANWTKWKENLIDFFNKLIFWEINPINSPLQKEIFTSVMWASINPTDLKSIFKEKWIKWEMSWNINKMRENLKK